MTFALHFSSCVQLKLCTLVSRIQPIASTAKDKLRRVQDRHNSSNHPAGWLCGERYGTTMTDPPPSQMEEYRAVYSTNLPPALQPHSHTTAYC